MAEEDRKLAVKQVIVGLANDELDWALGYAMAEYANRYDVESLMNLFSSTKMCLELPTKRARESYVKEM